MASEETPLINSFQLDPRSNESEDHDTVYQDETQHMTIGRRVARYLSNHSWYNPQGKSLDRAWEYFEHVTLARHFLPSSDEESKDLRRRAEPGESDRPTRLYDVLKTPESDLSDFGVGVGVYFFTLRALCIIMLLAGLINVPNLLYFASDAYNGSFQDYSLWHALQTSAICTDSTWVACPTCTKDQWNVFPATYGRYAASEDGKSFILRRNCEVNSRVAIVAYVSMLFICISVYILQKVTKYRERYFDESAQTTTDYAVEVVNPPKDAKDMQEWRDFFQQFGHVTCCTITLDNEELITALVTRRQLLIQLENLQPAGVVVDRNDIAAAVSTAEPVPWYYKLIGYMNAQAIQEKLATLENEILDDLAKRDYDVSNVFCIFETEQAQQEALMHLAVLGIDKLYNNTDALPRELLFRGNDVENAKVLNVKEPPEPSSVRWKDLDETVIVQLKQRLVTTLLTILIIILACVLVTYVRFKYGIVYAALTVSAINSIAPSACQYVVGYESHSSEGSRQSSLYVKITACLWINTALITAFITPFVDTLDGERDALIPAMLAIFITEMFKAPVTQVLDIGGHVNRHLFGPRAADQKRMNTYFQGTSWLLSERYTDMTNVLFLTFYYALLFPAGFFFASATLAIHYWVDKFCLLRNWAPAPMLGTEIADMSRIYFFSSAIAVYAIVSSYNYASFPYDNACEDGTTVLSDYVGTFDAISGSGNPVTIGIASGDRNYFYCNQDMMHYDPPAFPAVPSNQPVGGQWMTKEQRFSAVFGWTSVFIVIYVILIFLNALRKWLAPIFFRVYTRHVHNQEYKNENFSEILDIFAYVPQVLVPGESFPLLLCDVSKIDPELIGWEDPTAQTYDAHNAIYDLPGLSECNVFSVIQHWPPSKE